MSSPDEVTRLLRAWRSGDAGALDELAPLVYAELHRLAESRIRRERADHTLQATALVHEAYLRLAGADAPDWRDRAHFFAVAARMMRRILVDHARARGGPRRGGRVHKVSLEEAAVLADDRTTDILELDEALGRLAAFDPRQHQVVELRFFGGLSVEETAEVLGLSPITVKRDWRVARAWLYAELAGTRGAEA